MRVAIHCQQHHLSLVDRLLCNCPITTCMNLISLPTFVWGQISKLGSTIASDDPVEYKWWLFILIEKVSFAICAQICNGCLSQEVKLRKYSSVNFQTSIEKSFHIYGECDKT